jgi:mannosyltransferase
VALLAVAATGLRLLFLTKKPFWFDECFSVEAARLPWRDLGRLLWRREANMSLYYLLLRGWLHLGSSAFFIRSLSVVFSVAALPAIFWLARELFDRRTALLAVALLGCNAYHIRYAQEARSYSLFVLLTILSSGFFIAALRVPSRQNRRGYILASVFAVYGHLYAWLMLAAQWLFVRDNPAAKLLRRAWLFIGIATLPLIVFAAKTGAGPIRWISRPGLRDSLEFAEHLAGNNGLPLLALYAAACALAIFYRSNERPSRELASFATSSDAKKAPYQPNSARMDWRVRFLLVWLIFPPGLILLLSQARPLFLGRYFIFCLPPLVILAAAGLAKIPKGWLLGVSLGAMLLLSLQGTFSYYDHDFDVERDGSGAATNYILDHAQPGDAILFHIAEARAPYEFFRSMRRSPSESAVPGDPEIIYPRHGDHLDDRDLTGKPTLNFVQSIPLHYSRVWLVLMSNGTQDHPDATTLMIDQCLSQAFPKVERSQFRRVEVRLYVR